jgi:large subunit ribosomal protein L6
VSRIGKKPIAVPDKVQLAFDGRRMKAKGPKGALELDIPNEIDYKFENKTLTFACESQDKHARSLFGLTRALAFNVIHGVNEGFTKVLQIEGVGYKAEMKGSRLMLSLGFSHPVLMIPPDGIEFAVINPNTVHVKGIDKQMVGEFSARIRKLRPPEPYKGKGVRYEGEYIRRKAGKTSSK